MTPVVKAVQRARGAIVNIHGRKTIVDEQDFTGEGRRVNGMGTGVIVDERGYVLTNYHVVEGVDRIHVSMADGTDKIARLVARDDKTDLAIIMIPTDHPLPTIPVGTSSDLMLGESVIAIGNAYGYEHTITRGVISALNRAVEVSETQKYSNLIQTDASINPGNSGGPLLNIDGEMIGINAAVRVGAVGIGFAIPVDTAMAVAGKLLTIERIDNRYHGVDGVTMIDGPRQRFLVRNVAEGSPGAAAGLKAGDIVRGINDQEVARAIDFERRLIGAADATTQTLKIERGDTTLSLKLALSAPPAPKQTVEEQVWEVVGLKLTPSLASDFRRLRSSYRGGLKVLAVKPESPAARQGIRMGDVLVGMHVWETVSMDHMQYILSRPDFASIQPLKFFILRGGETLYGHLPMTLQR